MFPRLAGTVSKVATTSVVPIPHVGLVTMLLSARHCVISKALPRKRARELCSTAPRLDTTSVTLVDPVPGAFVRRESKTPKDAYENDIARDSCLRADVTTTAFSNEDPVDVLDFTPLSENQVVASAALKPIWLRGVPDS